MGPADLQLAFDLRCAGLAYYEIARVLMTQRGHNCLKAMRLAHEWSQRDAAEAWNRLWPDDVRTFKNFSYWESWFDGSPSGYSLNAPTLAKLAELYHCDAADLLHGFGGCRNLDRYFLDAEARSGSNVGSLVDDKRFELLTQVGEREDRLTRTAFRIARVLRDNAKSIEEALSLLDEVQQETSLPDCPRDMRDRLRIIFRSPTRAVMSGVVGRDGEDASRGDACPSMPGQVDET